MCMTTGRSRMTGRCIACRDDHACAVVRMAPHSCAASSSRHPMSGRCPEVPQTCALSRRTLPTTTAAFRRGPLRCARFIGDRRNAKVLPAASTATRLPTLARPSHSRGRPLGRRVDQPDIGARTDRHTLTRAAPAAPPWHAAPCANQHRPEHPQARESARDHVRSDQAGTRARRRAPPR